MPEAVFRFVVPVKLREAVTLKRTLLFRRTSVTALVIVSALPVAGCTAERGDGADPARGKYRGLLGRDSRKIKRQGGRTLLWAGGNEPAGAETQWYDFTGAVIPPEELQFGIGKDRIRAIDDPLFVSADDPRLLKAARRSYRRDDRPKTNNQIRVIGYANGKEARAYPVGLLDHHELVNDNIGGKPVTVGW